VPPITCPSSDEEVAVREAVVALEAGPVSLADDALLGGGSGTSPPPSLRKRGSSRYLLSGKLPTELAPTNESAQNGGLETEVSMHRSPRRYRKKRGRPRKDGMVPMEVITSPSSGEIPPDDADREAELLKSFRFNATQKRRLE
jgi:hypothetical protein